MPSVFISHSSLESELANYFSQWLEKTFPGTKCFCSSRPHDLPPGRKWLIDIFSKARKSDICLMMLSPYSANNSWLHFEAGMVLGAEIDGNKVIPVLYGGSTSSCAPPTVQHLQYLFLEEQKSFDAFISEHFLNNVDPSSEQNHSNFMAEISEKAKRIQKHGVFGSWIFKDIVTHPIVVSSLSDQPGNDSLTLKRYSFIDKAGEIVAVRASIIPRRISDIQPWKFGIAFTRQVEKNHREQIFQFHAGCHVGLTSWTIYYTPFAGHFVNEPSRLETERTCGLQLWLRPDKKSVACVGIDNESRYRVIMNDRAEDFWRLFDDSWTDINISAWADGNSFKIDVVNLEIDTIPYFDSHTLSWIG